MKRIKKLGKKLRMTNNSRLYLNGFFSFGHVGRHSNIEQNLSIHSYAFQDICPVFFALFPRQKHLECLWSARGRRVGIPEETRPHEGRVVLTPDACKQRVADGHELYIEKSGGRCSGYQDHEYEAAGVRVVENATAAVAGADLPVGAVMIAGVRAPEIVSNDDVKQMRVGSVVVDIAIDQGGCIATSRPTDYDDPAYRWHDVQHGCVAKLTGALPVTITQALSARVLLYLQWLLSGQLDHSNVLRSALNVGDGEYRHPALIDHSVD